MSPIIETQKLLDQAQSLIDQCHAEGAIKFVERALQIEPDNCRVLDLYADCLIELDRHGEAISVLQKSISISPDDSPFRYMNLGQLLSGTDALQCYGKGIQIMSSRLSSDDLMATRLSSGLCSMAELYMTDLCDEPNAEQACDDLLAQAIHVAPSNTDAYRSLANLRLIQQQFDQASDCVSKCLEIIGDRDHDDGESESGGAMSVAGRCDLAKICIELDRYSDAADLIDRCLCEDDSDPELFVLAGLCYLKEDDIDSCDDYLNQATQMLSKHPNPPLQAELDAILEELNRKRRSS
uniref:Tetratricopeptide repeat protein n=1 Tax=Spongospora subterranea TaxID=70186 RepID=A0A0H5R1L3_9EUKA|eukprot:CRZ07836.1 hypothetical protein [Spongospora subterranea]